MTRVQRALLTSAVVLAAGGGLAAYAFIEGYQGEKDRALEEAEKQRLFQFGRDHVKGGEIVKKELAVRFERSESGFVLTEPITGPADDESIGFAIDAMAAIRGDTITDDASPADLTSYGLEAPEITMIVRVDGGEHRLLVGGKNDVNERYYVTDEKKKKILAAEPTFYEKLDRDLYAFRSKRIFPLDRQKVNAIRVTERDKPRYVLEKGASGWSVSAGGKTFQADPFVMDRFLLLLTRDLKAEAFATDALAPGEERRFGLDEPRFVVEVEAGPVKLRGRVGTVAAGKDAGLRDSGEDDALSPGPWVQLEGTRTVAEVMEVFPSDLDKDLDVLRDHTISSFDEEAISKITFDLASGERGIVERVSGSGQSSRWSLTLPQTAPAKAWKVQKVLFVFAKLRSDRIESDAPSAKDLERWQLVPPKQKLTFSNASGEVIAEISIGKLVDKDHAFITAKDLGRVDAIKESRLVVIPQKLEDLVERAGE
jgi:hypothetical protein